MNSKYLRQENEDDIAYGLRLIELKKTEKPDDLDWQDIIDLLGLDLNRDSLRKAQDTPFGGYNIMKYFKEKMINNIEDDELLRKYEEKKTELEKERIRLNTTKIEYNKWLREDTRLEMLFNNIKDSIVKIEIPDFKPIDISKNKKEALLGISDFHFGKLFTSINNKYSEDIFYNRLNKLAAEVVELCKENNISHLHILNCGDDIEGMTLRISQLKSLQYGFSDQVIKLARYMAKFLNKLSENLEITYHHVLNGNHSEVRAFGDKTFTLENMERVIITYIHDILEDNKRIHIPNYNGKYVNFKIFDYNIYAQHGQKVRNPRRIIAYQHQRPTPHPRDTRTGLKPSRENKVLFRPAPSVASEATAIAERCGSIAASRAIQRCIADLRHTRTVLRGSMVKRSAIIFLTRGGQIMRNMHNT